MNIKIIMKGGHYESGRKSVFAPTVIKKPL